MCVSSRIVCRTQASGGEKVGPMSVEVSGGEFGRSSQTFSYQVQHLRRHKEAFVDQLWFGISDKTSVLCSLSGPVCDGCDP